MDTAALWTLITLQVATLLGVFYFLANRIEAVRVELSGKIDRVQDNLDGTRRELKGDVGGLASRLDAHIERHAQ